MQMKSVLLLGMLMCLTFALSWSQSLLELEIMNLARDVESVVGERLVGHNIAISDILDADGNAVELGKLIADELSFALGGQQDKFKIVDRSHFNTLMDEIDKRALLDDRTVLSLGKMVGISVVIYGKIYRQPDHYRIFLKYALLEQQVTDNLCRGRLTRLPSVDAMFHPKPPSNISAQGTPKDNSGSPNNITTSSIAPFQNGTLIIQFNGCAASGSTVQCSYTVTSLGRNETFFVYREGTFLQQGQRRSSPVLLSMNNQQSSHQLSTVLEANKPSTLMLQFRDFSGNVATSINLNGRTPTNFDFSYPVNNFIINKL